MKPLVTFVVCALSLAGCARNPGVVHLSGNDYMICRAGYAGMFANMPALKAEVIREANYFAAVRQKIAVPIRSAESRPSAGFPSYEYQFRLADPTNAPAATANEEKDKAEYERLKAKFGEPSK